MALEFGCSKCGAKVAVKFLRSGDEALCRSCGHRTEVPTDATFRTDTEVIVTGMNSVACRDTGDDPVRIPVVRPSLPI
jgi:DNA-directed RNA polymerase subunit RPC12/RpoP